MTHVQELFVKNLRFFRRRKKISQLKFSELICITPNYLNAVENGKNFPSPEVIQRISDTLDILPYQLFVEYPMEKGNFERGEAIIQELTQIKQRFITEIDEIIRNYVK